MIETDKEVLLRILCENGWIIKKHSYDNTVYLMSDECGHYMHITFGNDDIVWDIEIEDY